jgi:hypothetical protein
MDPLTSASPEQLELLRFAALSDAGCIHAITTRLGGTSQGQWSTLNLGHTVGDDPAHVEANHRLVFAALGLELPRVVCGRQAGGNRVALVTAEQAGQVIPNTDALVTLDPGLPLMLRFADCVPVLFWEPQRRAVAIAHAGWRGTVQRVAARTVQTMVSRLGCRAEDIRAAIGPSIGPCCFEVGPELVHTVRQQFGQVAEGWIGPGRGDRSFVDLWQVNAWQLREVGLEQIESAEVCTRCHRDRFYSHRGDGGKTGRFAGIIAGRPDETRVEVSDHGS